MTLVPGQKIGEFKDYSKPATNGSYDRKVSIPGVAKSKASQEDAAVKAELERLRAENAALKAAKSKTGGLSLKRGVVYGETRDAKGNKLPLRDKEGNTFPSSVVSLYGMGRFPVSLHAGQWLKLIDYAEHILTFIRENDIPITKED